MRRAAWLAFFLCAGCVSTKPLAPVVATAPEGMHLTATVLLCRANEDTPECAAKRAQWERKKQIKALIELLQEEFPDTANMNRGLRDHETAIMHWLEKHPYD